MIRQWLPTRFFRNKTLSPKARKRSNVFKPMLEELERREVLSTANDLTAGAASFVNGSNAPSFTATAISQSQVSLYWGNAVTGEDGYYVDEWINNAWQYIGTISNAYTGATVSGLSAGTTYYFDVGAYNNAGVLWFNYASATTYQVTAPAAPSLTATAVSSNQINLSWGSVVGATSYLVDAYYGGAWHNIASLASSTTGYAVTGLSPGATYTFAVGAYNAVGGNWSNAVSATTPTTYVTPTQPTQHSTSNNWSGYAAAGSQVTAVGGSWVVPAVSSNPNNALSSVWVGIDGEAALSPGSTTVEQIGTSEEMINGQARYYAWVEFYGDQSAQGTQGYYYLPKQIPLTIRPGDGISAHVSFVSGSTFRFDITDYPAGGGTPTAWGADLSMQYVVPQRSTAEWIVEAPGSSTGPYALANFGTASFTGAWATIGGTTGPINDFTNYALQMVDPAGGGTTVPSALVNTNVAGPYEYTGASSSFSVNYAGSTNSLNNAGSTPTYGGVLVPTGYVPTTVQTPAASLLGSSPDAIYVENLYELLLHRPADASASAWVTLLDQGGTRSTVIQAIESSAEYLATVVTGVYEHYLGREPDAAGLSGWVSALQNGWTVEQVIAGFIASPEFYQVQGGGTNTGFVTVFYQDVLGRKPDPAGLAAWVNALNTGAISADGLAWGFLQSWEYQADLVTSYYQQFLNRSPDAAGLNAWVQAMQAGLFSDQAMIAALLESDEGFADWSTVTTG